MVLWSHPLFLPKFYSDNTDYETIIFFPLACTCFLVTSSASQRGLSLNGRSECTEPLWDKEIEDNQIILHIVNDKLIDTLHLSGKQTHTETYAFKCTQIFGIIRGGKGSCTLVITEEDYLSHEIYFSYKKESYIGCGRLNNPEK